jgi:hypothetical protein
MEQIKKQINRIKHLLVLRYKQKNIPVIIITIVLLLILILLPLIASRKINIFSNASSINSVYPSGGTLSGNVSIVSDANAPGGNYVQLGTVATPTPQPIIAGYQTWNNSFDSGNNNYVSATQVTTGSTGGTLQSISIYMGAATSPSNHIQVGIYTDNGSNTPGTLLVSSGSQVITPNSWNTIPISGIAINPNTKYFLAFNLDGAATEFGRNSTTTGVSWWDSNVPFGTWPATFGSPNSSGTSQYAIYMTYVNGVATVPTPTPTTATIIPTFSSTFSAVNVSGNKLVNVQGQTVVLRGVNRDSAEQHCGNSNQIFSGPVDAPGIQAIRNWNTNVVRVPLNEDCWLGINGVVVGGTTYQQAIENVVSLLNQNGMYAIIDLHWSAPGTTLATGQNIMPDADHSTAFWTSVANAFKGNNEVLFDLYNEPYVSSWSCWKNGGASCTGSDAPFPIVGMQTLINAVRSTGATNVILLEGLSYGHDLSGWLANKPTDSLNNLTSSFHMYGNDVCATVSCWDSSLAPVLAQVPLIAGEYGESYDYTTCGTTAIDAFMNWMDQHNASYVAWEWDTWNLKCGTLSLVSDWSGTPYSPNGTDVKAHLLLVK